MESEAVRRDRSRESPYDSPQNSDPLPGEGRGSLFY